jgi:hypothetical protein
MLGLRKRKGYSALCIGGQGQRPYLLLFPRRGAAELSRCRKTDPDAAANPQNDAAANPQNDAAATPEHTNANTASNKVTAFAGSSLLKGRGDEFLYFHVVGFGLTPRIPDVLAAA